MSFSNRQRNLSRLSKQSAASSSARIPSTCRLRCTVILWAPATRTNWLRFSAMQLVQTVARGRSCQPCIRRLGCPSCRRSLRTQLCPLEAVRTRSREDL
ncbi:hypothetical protein COCON_G00228400 [Conger conger]|uniref:Uncharacterized protein n=1 Tax=Conger conger TaxID=82655 RepID=A0A9Q1CUZ9_CONCO|nr:hypothetical protein COCON_G00228400 [Conger conger]